MLAIDGWKTRPVFDRYNIVSERDLHAAAAKLETHLKRMETEHNGATKRRTLDLPDTLPS